MAKKAPQKQKQTESDSTYFLKLVLYIVLGTVWVKFAAPIEVFGFIFYGVPVGLVVGLMFASHDHFRIDRKIEIAVLLVMTIISYFLPAGIVI